MNSLAVIPARGGSKGVLRKNLAMVAGEPLIAYAIHAAKESKLLTSFYCSTDDEAIAKTCLEYGCPVIARPDALATDSALVVDALLHVLGVLEAQGKRSDIVVLLQPTSPIRTGLDIDNVIGMFEEPNVETVVSVHEVADEHPAHMYTIENGWLQPLDRMREVGNRADLPKVYHRNGAIYACRRHVLAEQKQLIGLMKRPYVMSRDRRSNIDDEMDLRIADMELRLWKKGRK